MHKYSGTELKERRETAEILAKDLAAAMDVGATRVSQIEARATVTTKTARRYLEALASLQVAKTSADGTAAS